MPENTEIKDVSKKRLNKSQQLKHELDIVTKQLSAKFDDKGQR